MAAAAPSSEGDEEAIEIQTPEGPIRCAPDEIVPRRFGISVKRRCLLLEYEVPRLCLLAHHPIEVDLGGGGGGAGGGAGAGAVGGGGYPATASSSSSASPPTAAAADGDRAAAERLKAAHGSWLCQVQVEQLATLVGRLRTAIGSAAAAGAGAAAAAAPPAARPKRRRRARSDHLPETARAAKRSKEPEIRKAYEVAKGETGGDSATVEEVICFIRDYLGFSKAEAEGFVEKATDGGVGGDGSVSFEQFSSIYWRLNPFMIENRKSEFILRKPGALGGLHQKFSANQLNLDSLEDCDVLVCTRTAQAFVDLCKRCVILLGPCDSSVFMRDCEDCEVWLAAQQLRTRDCKRCKFYLYSKTEPIIESSEDLAFAPWCAAYPGCELQFEQAKFDPQRNLWNALFDFSGKEAKCNWRILPLNEVREITVEYDDEPPAVAAAGAPPDNPVTKVTHQVLCAKPLASEESTGQSVSNIPQMRPQLPPEPPSGSAARSLKVSDEADRSKGRGPGSQTLGT